MRRTHSKTKKLNNKGLSLIELLIAMTILSIVAVVVYQSIVVSARTNAKAKLQHKATSLAQDVMEGLKAEDINTILHQFITRNDTNAGTALEFTVIPRKLLPSDLTNMVGSFGTYVGSHEVDGNPVYDTKYTPTSDHKYSLYLRNVAMENSKFDVLITMDGSAYVEGSTSNKGQDYNSRETVQLPDMDTSYDAIVSSCRANDGEAQAKVEMALAEVGGSFTPTKMKREITVYIDKVTMGGLEARVADSVKVEYKYTYDGSVVYQPEAETVYDNSSAMEYSLRNIFLFFTPGYQYAKDEIRIVNPDHSGAVLYLIKQRADITNIAVLESAYYPDIRIEEALSGADGSSLTRICTNLQENLETGAAVGTAKFYFNGALLGTKEQKEEKLHLSDLTNSTAEDKIMNVTVEVFRTLDESNTARTSPDDLKANAGARLAILTGSLRN